MCEPSSTIGTRMQSLTCHDDLALQDFAVRMRAILESPLPMDVDTRTLLPRILPLSNGARTLLVDFSDAIEIAQLPGGTLANMTGYASKAAEHAARIAGVLTLWADLHAPEVMAKDMADAIVLAQFYLSEARRLADAAQVSSEIDKAETLRKWLLTGWIKPRVLVRDVVQFGPGALRETPKARAALGVLEKHGWIVPLAPGTVVRGASRKEAWHVVRGGSDVV